MKSRISFFDKAVLRKDITRFAPLWAIYLIGGLLVMMTMVAGRNFSSAAQDLAEVIGPFSIINLIYAALCAQFLFGDLFNTRHCNALHALPLRRETWFVSHTVSGLLFSLVPHAIGAALVITMLQKLWFVGLFWLLGMVLEYLFFFGLAVFSVFCTGNRFAMAAVYGILNFASMIAYWFITTIYEPLLYGVSFNGELFGLFSPVIQMCVNNEMVLFDWEVSENGADGVWQYTGFGEGWGYLAVCAVVGIALLAASLLLYRRRKLECAGDFIAVKPLEPVFAVVFTICVGCVFAVVQQMFTSDYLLFLCVGLVIGWFVGQMLLQRTIRVFKGKVFAKLAVLLLTLGASIFLTWLDPLGITRWVPEPERVAAVEIDNASMIHHDRDSYIKLTDLEQIEEFVEVHGWAIDDRATSGTKVTVSIRYTMKDGRIVNRSYLIRENTKAWAYFSKLYNTPQRVLGYTDWEYFVENTGLVWEGRTLIDCCQDYAKHSKEPVDALELHDTMIRQLLEAMKKDCEEGNFSRYFGGDTYTKYWLELYSMDAGNYKYSNKDVYVQENSENTLAWLKKYDHILNFFLEE